MKSSIYISSEKIEVLGYSTAGRLRDYLASPLPEGTMISGKIIDPAQITDCLVSMRSQKPALFTEPILIVDGSSFLTKRIATPKLNKWQYLQLVKDEYADSVTDIDELLCDYYQLERSASSSSILACAVEKPLLYSYLECFKSAGIKPKGIRLGVQAILNYVAKRRDLLDKTFVLNVIDGFTMLSMIFVNGVNVFITRARLYGEDSSKLVRNILESLSGLTQFNRSQQFPDITNSFYLGLSDEDLEYMRSINPYESISLDSLPIFQGVKGANDVEIPVGAHLVYLNTLLGDDSIDLIRSIKSLEALKRRQRPKPLWILAVLGLVVLLAVPGTLLIMWTNELNAEISEINAYLTDPSNVAKSEQIDGVLAETSLYGNVVSQIGTKTENELKLAAISSKVLDLICNTNRATVTVSRLDFEETSGIVRVSCSSATESDAASYVDALKKSELVSDVYYTGYNLGNDRYDFSIEVALVTKEALQ